MEHKHLLILHDPSRSRTANLIASILIENIFPIEEFKVKTLESVILSGQPLNMKVEIDSAFAVLVLDSGNLFTDILTGFSTRYAIGKAICIFFSDEKTHDYILYAWGLPSLEYRPAPSSIFWQDLRTYLLQKLHDQK